jgi:DNA-binding transcriptional ArsR family regulator
MDSSRRSLVWYLLAGTRGGPNRIRILEELQTDPHNANQLAEALDMDYRTTRHHLRLLEQSGLVRRPMGDAYASPYELAPDLLAEFEIVLDVARRGRGARRGSPSPGSGIGSRQVRG